MTVCEIATCPFEGLAYKKRDLWVKHLNAVIPCDALASELLMHASKKT